MADRLVPDASVLASWLLREESAPRVDVLLNDVSRGRWRLSAPSLLWPELAHALKRRGYGLAPSREFFSQLDALGVDEFPLDALFPPALALSHDWNISIYDACYAALAHSLKATLATFDKDLARKVRKRSNIALWPPPAFLRDGRHVG